MVLRDRLITAIIFLAAATCSLAFSVGMAPRMIFNIGGAGSTSDLPALYDGWFKKTRQIERALVSSVKSTLKAGEPVEVLFPSVPNLDEVQFGTAINQAFGTEVAMDLGMAEYKPGSIIRRYLVQYSDLYWAKKVADPLPGTVWAVTAEGVKKDSSVISKPGKLKLGSLNNPATFASVGASDTVIIVAPGPTEQWRKAENFFPTQKMLYLNGALRETYDLSGPLQGLLQAYYVKRVSQGWIFRCAPGPWKAYLENPDGSLEVLKTYVDRPSLREVSAVIREESLKRYGMMNNRWAKGMGGRL